MSEQHSVSRRESLKTLGVVGAAIALGDAVAAQEPAPKAAASAQARPAANVVEVASSRMGKGHS